MSRILILLLLLSVQSLWAQDLSPDSKISVITCGVGEELYSVFGHTSLRIQDSTLKIDQVFDYGTFDFSTPNFYLKFIRGKLNYALSTRPFKHFRRAYELEDRSLLAQELDLSLEERQRILDNLKENFLEENRFYKYDFFLDNCVSRQITLLKKSWGAAWELDPNLIAQLPTYRESLQPYLYDKPWARFGINLILGVPADRKPKRFEEVFLPDQMKLLLEEVQRSDGQKLVMDERIIRPELLSNSIGLYQILPLLICTLLLIFGLLLGFIEYRMKKYFRLFDVLLFSVVGLAGWLFLTMWLLTDHTATHANLNLLWSIPLHLFFGLGLLRKKTRPYRLPYIKVSLLCSLIPLVFYVFLPQQLPLAAIPLVLLLAFRLSLLHKKFRVASKSLQVSA